MNTLTHGDLFTGIGGFSLAAQRVGFKTLYQCEIDKTCRAFLAENYNTILYHDITKIKANQLPYCDIITAGFPCQDISIANNKAAGIVGGRSGLWFSAQQIILQNKPRFVLIENSPQLTNKGLEYILYVLTKNGYVCEWTCVRACDFGYPQIRERLYLIAYLDKERRDGNKIFLEFFEKESNKKIHHDMGFEANRAFRVLLRNTVKCIASQSNYGIPQEVPVIAAYGNAVIPGIVQIFFEAIKNFINE